MNWYLKPSPAILLLGMLLLFSCARDVKEENTNVPLSIRQPEHFPKPVYTFDNNPPRRTVYELGKRMFFDPILSLDQQVSCGTCHAASAAFADPRGTAVSEGVFGRKGLRNTPALSNLIWYPHFNQDGGINHIEVQPVAPINDSLEMGVGIANAVSILQNHPEYPELFARAFDSDSVTAARILWAFAQFMGSLVSDNAPIDAYYRDNKPLPEKAMRGKAIFDEYCANCHSGVLQSDFSFKNNGLTMGSADIGRAEVTAESQDEGRFRVPSLRNVEYTAPYMHHGQLSTLRDVIEAYSSAIADHPNLDPSLPVGGFDFSSQQKEDLYQFLLQLSDQSFVNQSF